MTQPLEMQRFIDQLEKQKQIEGDVIKRQNEKLEKDRLLKERRLADKEISQ